MKKRSNWFLTTSALQNAGGESARGSRETSVGKSSVDAISSDALMSDVTGSDDESNDRACSDDGACSDLARSDAAGSDAGAFSDDPDCSFLNEVNHGETPASEPIPRRVVLVEPELSTNGENEHDISDHDNGDITVKTTSPKEGRYLQASQLTEREVRYFMVENWYGAMEDES